MIAHISDIPTVVSPASASNQARRLGSCDWCSNCGHVMPESSDSLTPLIPQSPLLLPDPTTVVEQWPRIVDAIQEGV